MEDLHNASFTSIENSDMKKSSKKKTNPDEPNNVILNLVNSYVQSLHLQGVMNLPLSSTKSSEKDKNKRGKELKPDETETGISISNGDIHNSSESSKKSKKRKDSKVSSLVDEIRASDIPDNNETTNIESMAKRRRKKDLKINVSTSKSSSVEDGGVANRSGGTNGSLPFSLMSNFSTSLLGSPVDKQGLYNSDMFSILGETPIDKTGSFEPLISSSGSKQALITATGGSYSSIGFDFDEVTKHFPSPRPGEALGASPNRWSGVSAGSFGVGMFEFPLRSNGNSDSKTGGITLMDNTVDASAADIHAKKFKRVSSKKQSNSTSATNLSDMSSGNDDPLSSPSLRL